MSNTTPHGPQATVMVVNDDATRINVLLTVSENGKGFAGDVDFTGTEFTITFPYGDDRHER